MATSGAEALQGRAVSFRLLKDHSLGSCLATATVGICFHFVILVLFVIIFSNKQAYNFKTISHKGKETATDGNSLAEKNGCPAGKKILVSANDRMIDYSIQLLGLIKLIST